MIIKFKGLTEKANWVFGTPFFDNGKEFILLDGKNFNNKIEVIKGTICQYINQNDRHGNEIYNNDVIIGSLRKSGTPARCKDKVFKIVYSDAQFHLSQIDWKICNGDYRWFPRFDECEVFGNLNTISEYGLENLVEEVNKRKTYRINERI